MHFRTFPLLRVLVASAAALCCSGGSSVLAQQPTTQQQRVQAIADDLRVRLEIPQAVRVSIVDTNHLLMSVEPVEPAEHSTERAFALYVEATFVATLDARLQKTFVLDSHTLALVVDIYNIPSMSSSVEEQTTNGPDVRVSTAVQPPFTLHAGVRLTF